MINNVLWLLHGIKNKHQTNLYLYTMNKNVFRRLYFLQLVSCFNSDKVKKLIVYFGLYKCPLPFCRRDNQIKTVYEK